MNDFDSFFYPDTFVVAGEELMGQRNMTKNEVLIPYTDEPDIGIGDQISQKSGKREIFLKVIDVSFMKGGSLNAGTNHPHMLTLKIENISSQEHQKNNNSSTINIGSVSGSNVQVGNSNSLSINISLKELTEEIAKSDDSVAKSKLKELLNNSTVASVIGAGVSSLLDLL